MNVVIVGGGFGGFFAARKLRRLTDHQRVAITLVSVTGLAARAIGRKSVGEALYVRAAVLRALGTANSAFSGAPGSRPTRWSRGSDCPSTTAGWSSAPASAPAATRRSSRSALARAYPICALPPARRRTGAVVSWALAGRRPDDVNPELVPLAEALAARPEK